LTVAALEVERLVCDLVLALNDTDSNLLLQVRGDERPRNFVLFYQRAAA
jgi:hypothetical protein